MSTMGNKDDLLITEEMISRYQQLNMEAKRIDNEMKQLKKIFHEYFDNEIGLNQKCECTFGQYKLQRRIQTKKEYHEEKTVQRLEELNLADCIKIIKLPDTPKIEAAIELGLVSLSELDDCIVERVIPSIWVKEIN